MQGIDKLFSGMRISSTGLVAERSRVDVIAENIANARTTRSLSGGAYRRKLVVFEPLIQHDADGSESVNGLAPPRVVEDTRTPMERILDPGHPDAGPDGMVEYPNVNTVMEMTDLVTAMRAYEANLTAQETFVRMAERALQMLR